MPEVTKLHEKLVLIQNELKVPKGQDNTFAKFKYRNLEDIEDKVKPFLKDHSLTLVLSDEMVEVGGRIYVRASVQLSDGKDKIVNTAYAREAETKKGMDDAQITGAASSYARKYAAAGLFLIDNTADADSMDNSKAAPKRSTAATTPVKAAPQPSDPSKHISEAQVKLVFARLKSKGIQSKDEANSAVYDLTGKDSVAEVTMGEMPDLLSGIDKMPDLSE